MRAWHPDDVIDFSRPIWVFRSHLNGEPQDLVYTQRSSPIPILSGETFEEWQPINDDGLYISPGGDVVALGALPGPVSPWRRFRLWLADLIGF